MTGLGLVGSAIGAAGSLMEGFEQSRSLKSSAKAKDKEAEQVRTRGIWEQIRINEEMRRTLSTQRQLYGQAGVTLEGAPMERMAQMKQELVLDRMMTAKNVASEVSALHADAKELRKAARAAKRAGVVGAFSSFF